MEFSLDEETRMVQEMARDFAAAELAPRAKQADLDETLDTKVFDLMNENGLMGLTVPEEYGGTGLGNVALTAVLEELNYACASTGVSVSVHNSLVGAPITKVGTEEQKQAWLPDVASGKRIGAYCLTEAQAGSDAGGLKCAAVEDGDHFRLTGTKMWVTNGGWAGLFIIYAVTDPDAPKGRGITAFIVPREAEGLSVGKHEHKTGIRGSSTTEILLEDVRVPAANILGERGRGFPLALATLDGGRIGIAAQALGLARACIDAAVKYSNEREQFGRTIGNFQAIQWKLADMATRYEAAKLLVYKAAEMRDRGEPCTRQAAQAKLFASQTANFCADECLQIHGGAGYTDDFHVERLFRDARITEIYEAATDIHRLVIARSLLTASPTTK